MCFATHTIQHKTNKSTNKRTDKRVKTRLFTSSILLQYLFTKVLIFSFLYNHDGMLKSQGGSQQDSRKSRSVTWKSDLHFPITDNGTSTRLSPVPCFLQSLHKEAWLSPEGTLADDGLVYTTVTDTHTTVTVVQEQLEKSVTMVPRHVVPNQSEQVASSVV